MACFRVSLIASVFPYLVSKEPYESRGFGFVTFAHPAKIEEVLAAGKNCVSR